MYTRLLKISSFSVVIFLYWFSGRCNNNHKILQFVPRDMKKDVQKFALDQGIYLKVAVIIKNTTIEETEFINII